MECPGGTIWRRHPVLDAISTVMTVLEPDLEGHALLPVDELLEKLRPGYGRQWECWQAPHPSQGPTSWFWWLDWRPQAIDWRAMSKALTRAFKALASDP